MTCKSLNCGAGCAGGRGRVIASSVILAKRGSPGQGQGSSTLSLLRQNHLGDSSPAAQALNDLQELKYGAGCGGNVDAEAQGLRHSEGYAVPRGIPSSGAEWYVVVTVSNQPGDSSVASGSL